MGEVIFGLKQKSVFQIILADKPTDKVLVNTTMIAYSESEAIEKVKVGSIIKELGLQRADVDFYIKIVGYLYEGETFAESLARTPELADELEPYYSKENFKLSELSGLTQAQLETYIDNNVTTLATAKTYLKKLSAVVLYLIKHTRLDQ